MRYNPESPALDWRLIFWPHIFIRISSSMAASPDNSPTHHLAGTSQHYTSVRSQHYTTVRAVRRLCSEYAFHPCTLVLGDSAIAVPPQSLRLRRYTHVRNTQIMKSFLQPSQGGELPAKQSEGAVFI
eukprot:1659760-Amphidinium_carterae.2